MQIKKSLEEIQSQKELKFGEGYISGYISLFFGLFGLGIVLCFMYPYFFVNPDLLPIYKNYIGFMRGILSFFIYTSLFFGLLSSYLSKNKLLGVVGITLSLVSLYLGGPNVGTIKHIGGGLYLGLDWFILDLFLSALVFIIVEKVFGNIKNQGIFREGWFLDLKYFFINHLLLGVLLITLNFVVNNIFSYLIIESIQAYIIKIPTFIQVILIFLIADFVFYWAHRSYHEKYFLWKVHSVHHSAEKMDWLAGSRLHVIELFLTRIFLILPIIFLGFSEMAVNYYILIVSIHSVFIHSNIYVGNSFLDKIIVLPKFHHWHHSDEKRAINKNYAGQIALYDALFGTAIYEDKYPTSYGITHKKDYPEGIIKQTLYPFLK